MEFCRKCNSRFEVHLHHIIPKSIGGLDKDGRLYFCKKHHDIIHLILLSVVWNYVDKKEEAREAIQKFTKKYSQEKIR